MAEITLELPFPPSVNTYWRRGPRCTYLSDSAKRYRTDVQAAVLSVRADKRLKGRLSVTVWLSAPTRRSYDVDNRAKGLLDSLAYAGVFENDEQVDDLRLIRVPVCVNKVGSAVVKIEEVLGVAR